MSKWDDKWLKAAKHWEDQRVSVDSSLEVIQGLQPLRTKQQFERSPKFDIKLLDQGQFGRSIDLPGAAVPEPITVLNLSGDSQQCRVVTVTLFNDLQPNSTTRQSVLARVKWGSGGIQAQADMDWMQGVTFSLPAAFLRISAFIESALAFGDPVRVGAFVGYYGAAPSQSRNPRLTRTAIVTPPGTVDIPIPVFATEMEIVRTIAAATGVSAAFDFVVLDDSGGTIYGETVAGGTRFNLQSLPNDARTLRLTNPSAVDTYTAKVMFFLSI